MYDRIPTPGREGRVLITPEDGSPSFYATIAMADTPLQEGTALSKATLLRDETAARFGMGAEAVPDDLFSLLAAVNQYGYRQRTVEEKLTPVVLPRLTPDVVYLIYGASTTSTQVDILYAEEVAVDETGTLYLVNSQTLTISVKDYSAAETVLKNKFFEASYPHEIYYCGEAFQLQSSSTSSSERLRIYGVHDVVVSDRTFGQWTDHAAATEANLPPEGLVGEVQTARYGQAKVNALYPTRVETGSYVGTGTYGEENPTVIDFGTIDPMFVILSGPWWKAANSVNIRPVLLTPYTAETGSSGNDNNLTIIPNGSTWALWSSETTSGDTPAYKGAQQANMAGQMYHWIAIGR